MLSHNNNIWANSILASCKHLSLSLSPTHTFTHTHTHTSTADTYRPVGPNNLKKQTEYKYLKPALPSAAADTVSVLILTPTIASLSLTLSPCLQHDWAATANSTSALHSHPTQDCRELCTSSASTHWHIHTFLPNRASSQPHSVWTLPSCFCVSLSHS